MTDVSGLGTILGVWAHPDDEAYLMGGIMALAARAGQRVACLTATSGEAGESADLRRWPTERLAEIRRAELAACLQLLGVTDHEWFGYLDGGLARVDEAEGAERVAAAIRRVRPDTVLTFGPDGMTGHADHRAVSTWTARAFDGHGAPGARLLMATQSVEWAVEFADINGLVFPGGEPPRVSREELALGVDLPDEVLELKVRALEAQASQTSGLVAAVGRARYAQWVRHEAFTEAP